MTDEAVESDDLRRALRFIVGRRPLFVTGLVALSFVTALLSGIGVGFIVPIVELAASDGAPTSGGLTGLFARAYDLVGIPLTIETAILGVGVVITARHTLKFLTQYYRNVLRAGFVRDLRLQASEAAIDARVAYYDDHGSDEILNAIVTQAKYAGGFINNGVELLQAVLVMLVYVAVAFYLAPELTLLTAGVFAAVALAIRFGFGSGYDAGEEVAEANETVQQYVQASTRGIRAVKLFGLGPEFYSNIHDAVETHAEALVRLGRNRSAFRQLNQLASALTVFGLLYLGLAVFSTPLSKLAAFLFTMFRLAPQVTSVNDIFYRAEGDLPHVVRMVEFTGSLEANAEPTVDAESGNSLAGPVRKISFDEVRFGYDDETVLDGVSFDVEHPEFVALVGQSGAGKSTVVSLLARMYELDSGRITANGTPIEDIPLREWRSRIAVVRQQPYIFNDTLRFNLQVGSPDADREELQQACEIAQVTEFLEDLPDGYDTRLGDDGVRLSGGQRQRIAIARALLKDAEVLVLDEATSDLDTGLETKVHRALEELDRDFITIAIAHRLSTVINADRIHVFDAGQIVETGQHQELVERDGKYANLYANQAKP